MNKKILLPVALFAATLGGASYINSQTIDNKNKIEVTEEPKKQIDEKDVFDFMKHTSIPIKHEIPSGLNFAMGLFGLGIMGAKRKEEAIKSINEIESLAKTDGEKENMELIKNCKKLRDYINKEELNRQEIEEIKAAAEYIENNLTDKINKDTKWAHALTCAWALNGSLNDDYSEDNEEYMISCMKTFDNIIAEIISISRKSSYFSSLEADAQLKRLRNLIEEGDSDFPKIKKELLELIDMQENSLKSFQNANPQQIAHDMYTKIPKMRWLIEKYITPKEDWDNGKNLKKFDYPEFEKYNSDRYMVFASDTLNKCRTLRHNLKLNNTKHVGGLVYAIQINMINYGSYNTQAFANAMILCDMILSNCGNDGSYKGSTSELTRNAKILFENVYTSINNPENNRPHGTVPRTFTEWVQEMERIERVPNREEEISFPEKLRGTKSEIQEKRRREQALEAERDISDAIPNTNNKTSNSKITFANVGGQDKAIEQLKKKVLYPVKYPNAFRNRMLSHGIIMHGRPGTGKTLVALALSNEADASFIKINASELTTSLHGETDKNWREIFAKARAQQPCIIFIDEFDTVAQKRGHNATNNYDDTVINTILTEMSDIEKNGDNVFVIGATNRFEVLDSGMIRAGRFGTHIELKAPETIKDVLQIFDIHTKDKQLDDDIDKEKLAQMMLNKNVTGSDIASIINEALENTFLRLGIYEKMENGTFNDNDLSDIQTNMADFVNAIENYEVIVDKKSEKRAVIGFNKR